MKYSMKNLVGLLMSSVSPKEHLLNDPLELKFPIDPSSILLDISSPEARSAIGKLNSNVLKDGYWYLSSQYTNHPEGRGQALYDSATVVAKLANNGISVYSPVIQMDVLMNDTDHLKQSMPEFWKSYNHPFIENSIGVIILKSDGWDSCDTLYFEYDLAKSIELPVIFVPYPLNNDSLALIVSSIKQEYQPEAG